MIGLADSLFKKAVPFGTKKNLMYSAVLCALYFICKMQPLFMVVFLLAVPKLFLTRYFVPERKWCQLVYRILMVLTIVLTLLGAIGGDPVIRSFFSLFEGVIVLFAVWTITGFIYGKVSKATVLVPLDIEDEEEEDLSELEDMDESNS